MWKKIGFGEEDEADLCERKKNAPRPKRDLSIRQQLPKRYQKNPDAKSSLAVKKQV